MRLFWDQQWLFFLRGGTNLTAWRMEYLFCLTENISFKHLAFIPFSDLKTCNNMERNLLSVIV